MVKETAFYDVLDVSPNASVDDIKRSYRKLALKYHPDKNPEGKEMFAKLSVAYETLADPEKRKRYDEFGEKGQSASGVDPSDIFASFFGGSRSRGEPKPKDIVHELGVALEHFYVGKLIKLAISRDRLCGECGGSGANKPGVEARCRDCGGRGVQLQTRQVGPGFLQQVQVACRGCGGKGSTLRAEDRCGTCRGEQIVKDKKIFEVHVERGAKRGDHVTFRGEGDQVPGVRLSGDIIIILDQKPHAAFVRRGDHLLLERTITLAEALTGFTLHVTQLDGRALAVRPPAGACVDPSKLWAIEREGMPVAGTGGAERGQLVVKFSVVFPQTLADADGAVLRRVLGAPAQQAPAAPDAECVELRPTTVDLNRQASQRQGDDDDSGHAGGAHAATCAQQ